MATYKQPIVNPEHLFKWEPEKQILFFITQGAHTTGTAMKHLFEVAPQVVEKLQKIVANDKPTIGTVIKVKDTLGCTFIVSRKHYNSRHDLDLVSSALASLDGGFYKMFNGDFPTIVDLVATQYRHIELKRLVNQDELIVGYYDVEWTPPDVSTINIDY
jgi:hypothetical protein